MTETIKFGKEEGFWRAECFQEGYYFQAQRLALNKKRKSSRTVDTMVGVDKKTVINVLRKTQVIKPKHYEERVRFATWDLTCTGMWSMRTPAGAAW